MRPRHANCSTPHAADRRGLTEQLLTPRSAPTPANPHESCLRQLGGHLLGQLVSHALNLAAHGQVDLAAAVLDHEAGNQAGVNDGLQLDVLRGGQLLWG